MSWSDIRTATKLKLESVSGVENVLDYVVWTDSWQDIMDLFEKDGRINTWMVGLGNNNLNELDAGLRNSTYIINIFAYYSIKTSNESSKTFEDLVMTVRDEFMKSFSYIKTYVPAYTDHAISRMPSTIIIDNAVYLQNPCHRLQMQIPITETVAQDISCSG